MSGQLISKYNTTCRHGSPGTQHHQPQTITESILAPPVSVEGSGIKFETRHAVQTYQSLVGRWPSLSLSLAAPHKQCSSCRKTKYTTPQCSVPTHKDRHPFRLVRDISALETELSQQRVRGIADSFPRPFGPLTNTALLRIVRQLPTVAINRITLRCKTHVYGREILIFSP